jgi:hypothetical protein
MIRAFSHRERETLDSLRERHGAEPDEGRLKEEEIRQISQFQSIQKIAHSSAAWQPCYLFHPNLSPLIKETYTHHRAFPC